MAAPRIRRADLAAPPNLVSAARLALVVPTLIVLARGARAAALVLLAIMVATDWLDGYLARRTGRITELGKILDPVADKVAIDGVLAVLVARGEFPVWAFCLVLARDALIVAGAAGLARRRLEVPASVGVGKAALVVLAAMTVAFVADLRAVETPLLIAGTAMVVVSGVAYAGIALGRGRRTDSSTE